MQLYCPSFNIFQKREKPVKRTTLDLKLLKTNSTAARDIAQNIYFNQYLLSI